METDIIPDAILSPDEMYRYVLSRIWDDTKPKVNFIGLNPSTADATKDDPTIRKCIAFAKLWGYGGMYMTNLFAYRATDFGKLVEANNNKIDPIGKDNNEHLKDIEKKSAQIVFAWGRQGTFNNRNKQVIGMFENAYCIELTADKQHPKHPLYLKGDLTPIKF